MAKTVLSGQINGTTLSIAGTAITATAAELNYVDGVTSSIQTQLDSIDPVKATQSKTYTSGETSTLTLSESITSGVPVVSVTKEVAQTGLTNNNWDVATDGTNYDLEDSAYATTLTPSDASADGTFTLGSGSFAAGDVGKIVSGNGGTAIVLNTDGDYNLLTNFDDTSAIASGSWTLKEMVVDGAATGFALASGTETVGGFVSSLNVAYYTGKSFSVASEDGTPNALIFNTDGTKMYILGYTFDGVFQYSLSTAFDVTTASYDSVSFSFTSQDTVPQAIAFNNDGTKLYMTGTSTNSVHQYSLSTAFDISTMSYDSVSFSVSSQDNSPTGLTFSSDGTKMYVSGNTSDTIYQYSLSTAFDLSTASYDSKSLSVSGQDTLPKSLIFNSDGTELYLMGTASGAVYKYYLTTAYNLSTAGYSLVSFDVTGQETTANSVAFNTDFSKMYIVGTVNDTVFEYNLNADFNLNAFSLNYEYITTLDERTPTTIAFNSDGTKMFMVGGVQDRIEEHTLSTAYDITSSDNNPYLFNVGSKDSIPEGICFSPNGTTLLMIGRSTNNIYEYALSTGFDLSTASYIQSVDVSTRETSCRAVVFNNNGSKLFFTGSSSAKVWEYDLSPTNYSLSSASVTTSFGVSSQDLQPQDVQFNPSGTKMYVTGRSTDSVYQYSLTTAFQVQTASYDSVSFSVNSQEANPTGLAFNSNGTKFFVIGSATDSVYQYSLSTAYDFSTASYDSVSQGVTYPTAVPTSPVLNNDGTKLFFIAQPQDKIFQATLDTAYDLYSIDRSTLAPFSVVSEDPLPEGVRFKSDGTKMYVLGNSTDSVYQYSLSTAFDVTTASYDSVSFAISEDTTPNDLEFNSDGTKMFIAGDTNNSIFQYSLSTAWDLSTASYDSVSLDISGEEGSVRGLTFNNDGTRLFTVGQGQDEVNLYTLTTAYDLTTALYASNLVTTAYINAPEGLTFSPDGTKLYVAGFNDPRIAELSIYNIKNAEYSENNFNVSSQESSPRHAIFNPTGTKMYVVGLSTDAVYQYSLSTAFDVSTASYDSVSLSVSSQDGSPSGLSFNNDGTKLYMIGYINKRVNEYTLSTAYDLSTASYSTQFSVNSQDALPKSVDFNADGTKMYIGGYTDKIYQYSLSTPFTVNTASYDSVSFNVVSQVTDLIAFRFSKTGTKLYAMDYDKIYQYTLTTPYDISTASYDSIVFSTISEGLYSYGLSFNTDETKMYVVNGSNTTVEEYNLGSTLAQIPVVYSSDYAVVVTNSSGQVDSTYFTDINSTTTTESVGTGEAYYAYSVDDHVTWKVIHNTNGERFIARNNSGTWEYNSNATYASTTWTSATTNSEIGALKQSLSVSANQMTGTQFDAVTDPNHLTLSTTMDFMIALKNADSTSTSPTSDGVSFNYDAASLNQGAVLGTDYNWDFPAADKVRITSLAAQNLKVRII